jgi:hypothetical protein
VYPPIIPACPYPTQPSVDCIPDFVQKNIVMDYPGNLVQEEPESPETSDEELPSDEEYISDDQPSKFDTLTKTCSATCSRLFPETVRSSIIIKPANMYTPDGTYKCNCVVPTKTRQCQYSCQ